MMERPLRDLLNLFDRFESVISHPEVAPAEARQGLIRLHLELTIEVEVKAFSQWCDGLQETGKRCSENSLWLLVLGFLLGLWWS